MSECEYAETIPAPKCPTAARLAEAEAQDKALRFDLDQLGIEARERDAVELVELRAQLAEAEVLIAKGLAVVHDFLPNIGRCVLQDYQRMDEFCCEAAARAADSATHRENDSHD